MTTGKWAVGMCVTSLVFFTAAGIAQHFVAVKFSLLIGLAAWIAAAYGFANAMQSKPAI